jgi:hypothetical protein
LIRDGRLYRISFSLSLLKFIKRHRGGEIHRITFRLGRSLQPGESSPNGLYAIVSTKNDWTLRITLFPELADFFRDDSRYIAECHLTRIGQEVLG